MKAISANHDSLFFNAATSAGSLTGPWSTPFQSEARDTERAAVRAARRHLRRFEKEDTDFSELAARAVLAIAMVGAYATAIWQIAGF